MSTFTKQYKVTSSIIVGYNDNDNPLKMKAADIKAVTVKELNTIIGNKRQFNIKLAESFLLGKVTAPLAKAHAADEAVRNYKHKNDKGKMVGYSVAEKAEKLVNVSNLFDNPRDSIVKQVKVLLRFSQLQLQNGWAWHLTQLTEDGRKTAQPSTTAITAGLRKLYPTEFRGGGKAPPKGADDKAPVDSTPTEVNADLQQTLDNERALTIKLRGNMRSHVDKALAMLEVINDEFDINGMKEIIAELTAVQIAAKTGMVEKSTPPKRDK